MRVVVLVPRRNDGGRRDQLWAFVKARYKREHPDLEVWEGHHESGPFNRSKAINLAADGAGDWDVAVIADSDSFVAANQLSAAVQCAADTGQITFAFNIWRALNQSMSDRVMAGFDGYWGDGVFAILYDSCSSMLAVRRDLWDETGGFDEGFWSWGAEDIAFAHAARTFGGGERRIIGDLWHLWHESASRDNVDNNVARADRYHAVLGDPAGMRALLAELKTGATV